MQITQISVQARNPDRVNIFVDGKYSFSLNILQITELGIKVGQKISEDNLQNYNSESDFGKLYVKCYKYCLVRPRSEFEVVTYLIKNNIHKEQYTKIINKLKNNNIINDYNFSRWWVENRNQKKGISSIKLKYELKQKGIDNLIIDEIMNESIRNDKEELLKIYSRKKNKYSKDKIVAYLASKGFKYRDILDTLDN